MERGAETLSRAVAGQRDATTGTVRVTTSDVAAAYLLPPILVALAAQEPGIQVEVVATNQIKNLLRREADIAVRMTRPQQSSLVVRKLASIEIIACAHQRYLARAGTPRQPADLLAHRVVGYDRDDAIVRGFARLGVVMTREQFAPRTDSQITYGRLIAEGAGIGFVARYNLRYLPDVVRVLPQLKIPALPCWLAVHREIHSSKLVRRVYDFLAAEIPPALA
jgi:DNA-binding transcriptional LysR family regulator